MLSQVPILLHRTVIVQESELLTVSKFESVDKMVGLWGKFLYVNTYQESIYSNINKNKEKFQRVNVLLLIKACQKIIISQTNKRAALLL